MELEREEIYHMIFIFFAVACAHVFVWGVYTSHVYMCTQHVQHVYISFRNFGEFIIYS